MKKYAFFILSAVSALTLGGCDQRVGYGVAQDKQLGTMETVQIVLEVGDGRPKSVKVSGSERSIEIPIPESAIIGPQHFLIQDYEGQEVQGRIYSETQSKIVYIDRRRRVGQKSSARVQPFFDESYITAKESQPVYGIERVKVLRTTTTEKFELSFRNLNSASDEKSLIIDGEFTSPKVEDKILQVVRPAH